MPGSKLARMEDIGGCRAILASRREIDGVLRRIRTNWDVKRDRDYMLDPKPSGYRGVHVVIERDGRRVEIQLRTPGQQDWAEMVERFDGRYSFGLKDNVGPEVMLDYVRLAGEGIAYDDASVVPGEDFEERFRIARDAVVRFIQSGGAEDAD